MHTPNLTPPRPVTHEARAIGTRATGWQPSSAPSASGGSRTWMVGTAAVALLVGGALFVAAPYRSADKLGRALTSGDVERLEEVIDFPALRDDLKRQATASLAGDDDTSSAGLRLAGAALANATIDALVQPEMVAKLPTLPMDEAVRARMERALDRARVGYNGFSSFTIRVVLVDLADEPIRIRLGRTGVFTWKVQGVTLPTDLSKVQDLGADEQRVPITVNGVALAR